MNGEQPSEGSSASAQQQSSNGFPSDLDSQRQVSIPVPAGLVAITKQTQACFGSGKDEYELEEVLGEGSYGAVYRCQRTRDCAAFAVKIIDTNRIGFVGGEAGIKAAESMAVREVEALRQLSSHPRVISLEAAFINKSTRQIFIVTELVPGSHLFSHVTKRRTPLSEPEASHIISQLSDALSFCHAVGVVHRDMKLENVLVEDVNMQLHENHNSQTGTIDWQTVELFSVKVCDFGFAKSLQAFTTRTPIGTGSYAAPEIRLSEQMMSHVGGSGTAGDIPMEQYDAFKADSYSLGVMLFVMLCLSFPSKDVGKRLHRSHKLWQTLSVDAQCLIDGLLEEDPVKRQSVVEVFNHHWVKHIDADDHAARRTRSRGMVLKQAENEGSQSLSSAMQSSHAKPLQQPSERMQDVLPGVLALHRALVHVQQERGMACWALSGSPGMAGITCLDQLQWHVQLTEKRIGEAKGLLSRKSSLEGDRCHPLGHLFTHLSKARNLAVASVSSEDQDVRSLVACFDRVFSLYNQACEGLIEIVASSVVAAGGENDSDGRRAARKYRLFSAAAEQLSRERAFISSHGPEGKFGLATLLSYEPKPWDRQQTLDSVAETPESLELEPEGFRTAVQGEPSPERLYRLAEIIGARKILLGTVVDSHTGNTTATSEGLLATIVWEEEGSLFSLNDIARFDFLERRVLAPTTHQPAPMEEWYQMISRFIKEIHSRVAISLIKDVRLHRNGDFATNVFGKRQLLPSYKLEVDCANGLADSSKKKTVERSKDSRCCGCRAGIKLCLLSLAERL